MMGVWDEQAAIPRVSLCPRGSGRTANGRLAPISTSITDREIGQLTESRRTSRSSATRRPRPADRPIHAHRGRTNCDERALPGLRPEVLRRAAEDLESQDRPRLSAHGAARGNPVAELERRRTERVSSPKAFDALTNPCAGGSTSGAGRAHGARGQGHRAIPTNASR